MTQPKHSPTPWNNGCDATGKPLIFQTREVPFGDVVPEYQANRALLDAAPDMLAALADLHDYWTNEDSQHHIDTLKAKARAAIARATGAAS